MKRLSILIGILFPPFLGIAQELPVSFNIDDKAVSTFHFDGYPDWIETGENTIWIANDKLNCIQQIDPSSGEIIGFVNINKPCAAFTIGFGSVWVMSCGDHAIVRINLKENKKVASIPISIAGDEGSIVADENGVWVLSDAKGILSRIDPITNKIVAQIAVNPNSFAAMSGYGSIWITNTGEESSTQPGSVQRIDPRTNKVTATIAVGVQPRFLAVGEAGIWAFNQTDGSVSRIDPYSNKVVATIQCNVPGTGGDIAAGEGYVWVRAKNELLLVIDPSSNKVVTKFGPTAGSGAVRTSNGFVWVSAHDVNKVWKLDPKSLK